MFSFVSFLSQFYACAGRPVGFYFRFKSRRGGSAPRRIVFAKLKENTNKTRTMKNRLNRHAKALTMALAALSICAAHAQTTNTLPTTYAYPLSAANTNAPGFIWNVSQVLNSEVGSISWAESQIAGEQGTNLADPTEIYSSASANATVPSNPLLPISFIIPGSINFSIAGPGDCGHNRKDLPCEDGMVGTPGTEGGTTNVAAEALTYLALPQGLVTMGVTSDDGFQLQIGAANPGDRYSSNAVVVESYNGTRGYADSIVTFNVAEAGLYAARLLYFQGGGDASVEWYTFPPAGTTNVSLGEANTGTNAVLINDVADSGIAAYQAITASPLGSYCSSLYPAPGSTGIPNLPTITATLINGAVPVTNISLTVDGVALTPTVTTTANGVAITFSSYSFLQPLANLFAHILVLQWDDNGATLSVRSTFTSQGFITLDSSQIVTPDTAKPGFLFNVFANSQDYLVRSVGGIQGGESDNLDNIELGLNGLLTNGGGGFLPNEATLATAGAAEGPAPALGGPSAPAKFIITNTISLNGGNLPGFPAQDGGTDPTHSEVLTYVYLPVGLTTFTLDLDGFYRAYAGSWDYLKGVMVGTLDNAVEGQTSFGLYAKTAGYYPLRITAFNLDGTPNESLLSTGPDGTNVLVNDIAHGGLPAYYALSTPSSPYVRYASPRPVPRQVEYPSSRVLLRLQDSDNTVNDSSAVFNLDGNNVTITNNRVGDVLELTWTATTLQTPAEIHSGILTYKDSGGNSLSNAWSFLNLKAVWLPTASAGYWLPTNAVAVEDFSEYADPTEFTNGSPTTVMFIGAPAGQWYKSPQPENPLVDVAPVWTNVPAGPTNWFVWNWDEPGDDSFDLTDSNSRAYENFLCLDAGAFANLESTSANTAPGETINGVPLIQLEATTSQNILIAESDNRAGDTFSSIPGVNPGQNQYAMSKRFDLTGVTNPVIAFAAIQKQNQDNINSVEYSPDGGVTWAPIIYYLDGHAQGSDPADIQINNDNTVNVINTLFFDVNPGEIPLWTDSTGDVNHTYGSCIAAPISQALAPFFAPRVNDDSFDGKRIEVVRLPLAANKSDVRIRLGQIGSCSWYFGVTQIAFFDVPPSGATVPTGLPAATQPTLSIAPPASGKVTITWTGSGTLQSATSLTGNESDWTAVTPAPTGNSYQATLTSGDMFFRLVSN